MGAQLQPLAWLTPRELNNVNSNVHLHLISLRFKCVLTVPLMTSSSDSLKRSLPPLSPSIPSRFRRSRRLIPRLCRSGTLTFALITAACLSGVFLLALVLSVHDWSPSIGLLSVLPLDSPGQPEQPFNTAPPQVSLPRPQRKHDDDHLDLEEIRDLVAKTKGYFVRDYSLGLGWNNVRYHD